MNLTIDTSKTILAIQQEFNAFFPFLKIEFFTRAHQRGKASEAKYILSPGRRLEEFVGRAVKTERDLRSDMTVFQLEKMFEDEFGLHIQVFRKSGRIWLETTVTDDWTLELQNEQGKELSTPNQSKDEAPDYHEQE